MVSPPVDRRSADLPSTLFNYPQDKEKAAPRRNYSAQLWQSFDLSTVLAAAKSIRFTTATLGTNMLER
jgi:hypothetical protein